MIFKNTILGCTIHIRHPYIIILRWGFYLVPFFIFCSLVIIYFIQLHLESLQNQLEIGYNTLSATFDTLNTTKDILSSLSNDFAKVTEELQSTTKNLQNLKPELNPICKQFLTGKLDLFRAYIKIGGISGKK